MTPLFAITALALPEDGSAQVYVLVNNQGKSILISGDKSRAPEVFIAKEMRLKGNSGWRVQFATSDKICWARRAVEGIFQPSKWVVETGPTRKDAENSAKQAADEVSARPDYGINTWEGAGCNTTAFPFQKLDIAKLENLATAPVQDTSIIDVVKGQIRSQVGTASQGSSTGFGTCDPQLAADGKSARAALRLPSEKIVSSKAPATSKSDPQGGPELRKRGGSSCFPPPGGPRG